MATEAIEFRDFMAELNGTQHDDIALMNILFYQCDRIFHESGSPIAVDVFDRNALVYEKGVWGRAPFHEVHIFAKVKNEFYLYDFATRPIYEQGTDKSGYPITSEYQEFKFKTREEMANWRKRTWPFFVLAADRAARANYGLGDTKLIIDGFYEHWTRHWMDQVRKEEAAASA